MDQVSDDIADQDAPVKLFAEAIPADVAHAARSREIAGLFGMVWSRLRRRDGIDSSHVAMIGNARGALNGQKARPTTQVTLRDKVVLNVVDVVSNKAPPPLIEHQPESAAGMERRGEVTRLRVKAEIQPVQGCGRATCAERSHASPIAAIQTVHPVVQAPAQAIDVAVSH